jgi:hypothetical protein
MGISVKFVKCGVGLVKVYVTMKGLGRRKGYLEKVGYELNGRPGTIQELITELVSIQVQTYNQQGHGAALQFLTNQGIEDRAAIGKVGFQTIYNEEKADLAKSIQMALQAFEDGLFKVFINETEQEIQAPFSLKEGDQLVFIKLTMLAGRMW